MDLKEGVAVQDILELKQDVNKKELYIAFKSMYDGLLAFILIIALCPLMAAIYLIIRLDSKGPGIYKQLYYGKDGKFFILYKFRSMYFDGSLSSEFIDEENGIFLKTKNDPRITPVGKIIRKTSLDELPQLFNVLFGDMSLVGPRPIFYKFGKPFPNAVETRSIIKPGITGLWQIKSRQYCQTLLDMMPYDLEYIQKMSLKLDLKILLITIPKVLKCDGAI